MVHGKAGKHIVFIGLNYQPRRRTSDKNFWVELIPILAARLRRISVISIRDHHLPEESETIGDCVVKTKYLSSKLLGAWDGGMGGYKISWKGKFPGWLGVIEKSLNTKALLYELDVLRREDRYDHIHLMENFGLVNTHITERVRVPISVSAISYQGRRPLWLYDMYLKASYRHKRLIVVPFSRPFGDKLVDMGIASERTRRIPWGVNAVPDPKGVAETPSRDLKSYRPLILWAGYGQQIGRNDFLLAYQIAEEALSSGINANFFFAFKPESFEKHLESYSSPDEGLTVTSTTTTEFHQLKRIADIFFSPVVNRRCIVAPPLTWLEVLGSGMPIVTTDVPGTAEVVVPGQTGFRALHKRELVQHLFSAVENYKGMRKSCVDVLKKGYNLRDIAGEYLELFGVDGGGF